ncbi:hypothetical protein AB0B94_03445 [Micromonospora sp. NPDC048986]|uniref:hypothetical protein n=1 Tax=Micromonospora sp. NPDC048986 TaxID=3155644 RepID=UPI0033F0DF9F
MRLNRPSRRSLWVSIPTIAGIGTLLGAFALTSDGAGDWTAGVLVNVGASVILIVPVYLLSKRLDERIEQVGSETQSSVQALTDRVETFEQDVERRIDDVAASVSARLLQESQADAAAFEALGSMPSRDAVLRALRRANGLNLISQRRGPRVCVSEEWRLFVQISYDEEPDYFRGEEDVTFTVESYDGTAVEIVPWGESDDVETVLVKLGRILQKSTASHQLDVKALFEELSEALAVAQTDPDRRPIWQLCPPQWAVTAHGITTYGSAPHYVASVDALEMNSHLATHIAEKTWVDEDSLDEAVGVALALNKAQRLGRHF